MKTDYVACRFCGEFLGTDMVQRDMCEECMGLRDFFAGCALTANTIAVIANNAGWPTEEDCARDAYALADAMLKARSER